MLKSPWTSFILFIIFLGGLMVLFVYIVSLASNEKFLMETEMMSSISTFSIIMIVLIFLCSSFDYQAASFSKIFSIISLLTLKINMIMSSFVMFYLFIALLVAVKISSKFEGPLRSVK